MVDSLSRTGRSDEFDFFVLSDSTRYDIWLQEEELWRKNCQSAKEQSFVTQCRIFYRHRSKNTARKSGNIADFCEHWCDRYQFMIVLDADSLVEGETIVTMVDRISSDQRIGILQVPPVPVGRSSMFARIQHWLRHFFPLSNVPAEPADNCGKSSNQRGAKNRLPLNLF